MIFSIVNLVIYNLKNPKKMARARAMLRMHDGTWIQINECTIMEIFGKRRAQEGFRHVKHPQTTPCVKLPNY
jgi:hypothetical protein